MCYNGTCILFLYMHLQPWLFVCVLVMDVNVIMIWLIEINFFKFTCADVIASISMYVVPRVLLFFLCLQVSRVSA